MTQYDRHQDTFPGTISDREREAIDAMDENQLRALLDEDQLQAHLTLGHTSPGSPPSYVEWRLDRTKLANLERESTFLSVILGLGIVLMVTLFTLALVES